jgi:hypothetical protein
MPGATSPSTSPHDLARAPGPDPDVAATPASTHRGVIVTGDNGEDGHKAFYIHIEAREGCEEEVIRMLGDIYGCVLNEPATGPWFAVRYAPRLFGIFEAFPSLAGRDAHVAGGGGDIFRDHARMNHILARPAHVFRLDVLLNKAAIGR